MVKDQLINEATPEPAPFNIEQVLISMRGSMREDLNNKFEKSQNENKENREKLDNLDQRLQQSIKILKNN